MCRAWKSSLDFFGPYLFFPLPPSPQPPISPPRPPPPHFLLQTHLCFAASGIWKIRLCSRYLSFICVSMYTAHACVYIYVCAVRGLVWCAVWALVLGGFVLFCFVFDETSTP